MTSDERVMRVAEALWEVESNPYKDASDYREFARAAIAESDAALEVTDAVVGVAWAMYCEYLVHDNFTPDAMRIILQTAIRGSIAV